MLHRGDGGDEQTRGDGRFNDVMLQFLSAILTFPLSKLETPQNQNLSLDFLSRRRTCLFNVANK